MRIKIKKEPEVSHDFSLATLLKDLPDPVFSKKGIEFNRERFLSDIASLYQGLKNIGMKNGDRVVLAIEPGYEMLVTFYALMGIGACMAIIDPEMGRDNYRAKWEQFKPQWAFADSRLLFLREHPFLRWILTFFNDQLLEMPFSSSVKWIQTGWPLPLFSSTVKWKKLLKNKAEDLAKTPLELDQDFLITYTSGTLHQPKGVIHHLAGVLNSLNHLSALLKKGEGIKVATHLPQYMILGVQSGLEVIWWDPSWSAEQRFQFIRDHQITTLFGPPAEFLPLLQYCEERMILFPTCLQQLVLGSAPMHPPFLKRLVRHLPERTRVDCLYGMTENLLVCHVDGREKSSYEGIGDLLGDPLPEVKIRIEPDQEISIHSDQLFIRYYHQEERPYFHKTGDLGFVDQQGRLVMLGRKKDMIIRKNFNIYPALYEPTVEKIPGVDHAVMLGIYDEARADEVVFLVLEGTKFLTPEKVKEAIRSGKHSIDKEAWPDQIVIQTLPRSGRQQKIDRQQLRKELYQSWFL